jgi:hypothetical protein
MSAVSWVIWLFIVKKNDEKKNCFQYIYERNEYNLLEFIKQIYNITLTLMFIV